MIDAISSKSRRILSKSGRVVYRKAKQLRASIVILPFFATVLISFIYLKWDFPPLWLQDFILLSAPLLVGVVLYCKTWIYRFPLGVPLLAVALAGALFFPVVVCTHILDYNVFDNGIGLGVGIFTWALSTFLIWKTFQPSSDMFWNTLLERFRQDRRRWIVIALVPLVWGVYGFGAFELVDTQFDRAAGRVFHIPVKAKTMSSQRRSGAMYYVQLAPWRFQSGDPPLVMGEKVPYLIYDQLTVGKPACLTLHPGFLGAPWQQVAACAPVR
jgi:hypothetical protein